MVPRVEPGVEFLQEPFTADALNRRVREVLDGWHAGRADGVAAGETKVQ